MKKDRTRGYTVPNRPVIKPSGIDKAQNGLNVPRKKPEESKDETKPTKG